MYQFDDSGRTSESSPCAGKEASLKHLNSSIEPRYVQMLIDALGFREFYLGETTYLGIARITEMHIEITIIGT